MLDLQSDLDPSSYGFGLQHLNGVQAWTIWVQPHTSIVKASENNRNPISMPPPIIGAQFSPKVGVDFDEEVACRTLFPDILETI